MGKRKGKESKIRITRISKRLHSVDKPDRHRNRLREPRRWGQREERRAPGAGASIPRAVVGTVGKTEPDEGVAGSREERGASPPAGAESPMAGSHSAAGPRGTCAPCEPQAEPEQPAALPLPPPLPTLFKCPKVSRVPGRPRTPSRVVTDRGGGPMASVPRKEVQGLTHPRVPR